MSAPPKLDANLPTTPAHEWADKTLQQASSAPTTNTPAAGADTPGNEVPGSFPNEEGGLDVTKDLGAAVEKAKGLGQAAYEYLRTFPSILPYIHLTFVIPVGKPASGPTTATAAPPEIQTTTNTTPHSTSEPPTTSDLSAKLSEAGVAATTLAGSAYESAKNYLPTTTTTAAANTTAIAPATSLPSREVAGAQPGDHSSGVGALPGTINEAGVAKLPAEVYSANDPKEVVSRDPATGGSTNNAQGGVGVGEKAAGVGAGVAGSAGAVYEYLGTSFSLFPSHPLPILLPLLLSNFFL